MDIQRLMGCCQEAYRDITKSPLNVLLQSIHVHVHVSSKLNNNVYLLCQCISIHTCIMRSIIILPLIFGCILCTIVHMFFKKVTFVCLPTCTSFINILKLCFLFPIKHSLTTCHIYYGG